MVLSLPLPSLAGELSLGWTNPTLNTDGTPIPATGPLALSGVTAQFTTCSSAATVSWPTTPLSVTYTAPLTSGKLFNLTDKQGYCIRLYAQNNNGDKSTFTVTGFGVASSVLPNPPSGLVVVDTTVYYVIQQAGKFVLLPVGTVPNGTPCDSTQNVNGHSAVPTSAVTWFGSVRPIVVVAQCG